MLARPAGEGVYRPCLYTCCRTWANGLHAGMATERDSWTNVRRNVGHAYLLHRPWNPSARAEGVHVRGEARGRSGRHLSRRHRVHQIEAIFSSPCSACRPVLHLSANWRMSEQVVHVVHVPARTVGCIRCRSNTPANWRESTAKRNRKEDALAVQPMRRTLSLDVAFADLAYIPTLQ